MIDLDGQGHEPLPTLKLIETGSNFAHPPERRIAARRAQILEAAEAVFAAKGYHGATTREIAQAADVSEGTLYNYFANKRDLFIGLMASRTDELVESIAEVQADSVEGAMVQLLAGQFTRMRKTPPISPLPARGTTGPGAQPYPGARRCCHASASRSSD